MKLRCMICKQERELTVEEVKEYGERIERKNLRAVDYLNLVSIEDGYTCTGDKKHKYEFDEEFDEETHGLAKDLKNKNLEKQETAKEIDIIEAKMRELKEESDKKIQLVKDLDSQTGELEIKLESRVGNKKYELWTF